MLVRPTGWTVSRTGRILGPMAIPVAHDPLGEALHFLRMSGVFYCRSEFTAPWALDLPAFAHRPVAQLSGGERGRALLARVLAGTPRWLLADEPLANLDLAHQLSLLGHLRACADQGMGVVLVLHDLALAMNHADRVVVLDQGQLAADGSPELALAEAVLEQVWGVKARWLGEPGARALAV